MNSFERNHLPRAMTRILIADDNAQVRTALRICLEMNRSWQVCGEAQDGQDAVEQAQRLKPDVLLLDYAMPAINGVEAARLVSSSLPECVLILFTMFASTQLSQLAQAAGVHTVISKDVGGVRALVQTLEKITISAA